ncbi:hypothetical protein [Nocardia sp. NPDC050175]|uniref:hypothetical protein n=1 Tax=Nocardia sp. NPDC050175 TaxID=3364317 RepID=UPI0037912C5A
MQVNPTELIAKGKKLADLPSAANGLFDILKKLNNSIQSLGTPWGDDELGKQFSEGASGYLAAVDSLVGNATPGPDAKGAIPVYGQILVNYGKTIEEAGKAFSLGEDLYAQWMLGNYVNENAKGNPGPYRGPLSSDPNFGKKDDKNNQAPPPGNQYQGPGGGGQGPGGSSQGGPNAGGPNSAGPNAGGPSAGGPNAGGPNAGGLNPKGPNTDDTDGQSAPPPSNYALSGSPSSRTPDSGIDTSDGPLDSTTASGSPLTGMSLPPGALGLNASGPAIDPVTGLPVDKTGAPIASSKVGGGEGAGGNAAGSPRAPLPGSAFDGEKLASKNVGAGIPTRAGMPGSGMTPGMPSTPGSGAAGGGAAEGKKKGRGERRKPPTSDEVEDESGADDPWQRSGWPGGGR